MLYDIVVIGSGPCGLAAVARICEKTPSALFTNEEHARYWKKHRRHDNSLEQEQRKRKGSADSGYGSGNEDEQTRPSITVLDASSSEWLSSWKQRFRDLKISHLRSPLFFHPDPRDRDGLLAFAHEQDRLDELREIPNVVGKELSKHTKKRQHSRKQPRKVPVHLRIDGRDQIDYHTPSSQLFEDHCDMIIERYRLRNLVQKATVLDISYDPNPPNLTHGLFTITTEEGVLHSRIAIVATGPSTQPRIPNIGDLPLLEAQQGSMKHVFQPNGTHLPTHTQAKLKNTPTEPVNIIIVGGGLTSAQLTDLLLTKYTNHPDFHIYLLLRHSKLKQKPFDIDLPWVSKTRNHLMSTYWSADTDTDRLNMLQTARNGGSVNPPFAKILQKYAASGRLTIHTNTHLHLDKTCLWNDTSKTWTHLITSSTNPDSSTLQIPSTGIDHIIFCTSATPSLPSIPFLQTIQRDDPVETLGGLPVINDDLMYKRHTPLFFTGALAALRLGPGAANLAGARQGAERIAWAVEDILGLNDGKASGRERVSAENEKDVGGEMGTRGKRTGEDDVQEQQRGRNEFTGSFSNQFAALDLEV